MNEKNGKNEAANRIGYGLKVPIISLEEVIEITKVAFTKAGDNNSIDALARITNNSRSSSHFTKKMAALKNYGVFNFDKSNYSITELGKKIAAPNSFDEQATAIIEVFENQENLRKIWENFKGKRLPQGEFLENAIIKILGIPIELKNIWVEYFVRAAKYAGLLDERESGSYQVLTGYTPAFKDKTEEKPKMEKPDEAKVINPERKPETINYKAPEPFGIADKSWGILNIKTISNDRKAIFAIPEDLTQKDIDALKVLINGIEVQLDGLKKMEDREITIEG